MTTTKPLPVDGIMTCEDCGSEDATEFAAVIFDPDAVRDDGPPRYTVYAWLCDAHADELQNDDLTIHMGRT